MEVAEYLKVRQPGWAAPIVVGVPGVRSLTADEQAANEQLLKDRAQAAKDSAAARAKAEVLAHRAQTALAMEQRKAEMMAHHEESIARHEEVKAAVPEQHRRASMKKAKVGAFSLFLFLAPPSLPWRDPFLGRSFCPGLPFCS